MQVTIKCIGDTLDMWKYDGKNNDFLTCYENKDFI